MFRPQETRHQPWDLSVCNPLIVKLGDAAVHAFIAHNNLTHVGNIRCNLRQTVPIYGEYCIPWMGDLRLARELHDGVGPLLTTIKLYVQNKIDQSEHKESLKTMIDTTINEIRQMTNILMPTSLDKFGIGATLSNYVNNIQKSIKTSILFEDLTKENASKISKEQEINIFRIVQELINNSIKHSNATKIRITLTEFDHLLSLFYFDDGIGFDIEKVKLGSGITNIKERVEIFDGTLEIDSYKKTIVEIEMPIKI